MNDGNLNKQYINTEQFNQGKDYAQKKGEKNFQTNMNNTLGNNQNEGNKEKNTVEDKKSKDKCIIF